MRLRSVCRSTGFRTALLYAVLFGTSVLVVCGVVYWQTTRYMERQLHAVVDADLWSLTASTEQGSLMPLRDAIRARLAAARGHAAWYLLQDPQGTVVAGNLPARVLPPGWVTLHAPRGDAGTAVRPTRKGHLVLGRGLPLADGAFLFVGHDAHQLEEMRELLVGALGWGVGVTFVLAVVGGAIMGAGTLRRVDAINRVAGEIVRGDLSRRMPVRGTDNEFDLLAQHLNHMLERMQALMEGMRQVTNDIAHDLRTPLGRLRQRLEGVRRDATTVAEYQGAVDQALAETDQILATFAALLRIAQIESGHRRARFTDVDLVAVLETILDAYTPVAEESGHALHGIRMKLSIDNCCKFNGFMLLSQTRAEYLCCCASLSRRLGHQMFCGGTGTGEKAAECQLGLKNRLHPPIGQRLEMSDEFDKTQRTFFLQPQGMTHLWAQRIIKQNKQHATIEIT